MHETDADLEELQGLLDATRGRTGEHLAGIFEDAEHFRPVPAAELAERLTGMRLLTVGTVNSKGEPRVAPVDGHFHRGRWFFSTPGNAFRVAHLKRNPAISAVHTEGESFMTQVHGTAELIGRGDPGWDELDARWAAHYGGSASGLGDEIWFVRIRPERMVAYEFKGA